MRNTAHQNVITTIPIPYKYTDEGADSVNDFVSKKLISTYEKNGMTVKVYRPVLTKEQQEQRDVQIKSEIIKALKD